MGSELLRIVGEEIQPGSSGQLNLEIAKLHTRTPIEVPVIYRTAKKPGPVVLLLAGIHGDELNGVEIVRRMIRNKQFTPTSGALLFVPTLNVFGFLNKTREFPDGRDLNRSFPGSKTGSLASRFAYYFRKYIALDVDYVIDFHTGGGQRHNYPQIRVDAGDVTSMRLAKVFQPKFIIEAPEREHTFRANAQASGKHVLLFEGGHALEFDEQVIQAGVDGTKNVLRHLKMMEPSTSEIRNNSAVPVVINQSKWIRAKSAGLFKARVENGAQVTKQQIIGEINDAYGDFHQLVRAPMAGFVICVNEMPVVNQGDALIHIGVEKVTLKQKRKTTPKNFMD